VKPESIGYLDLATRINPAALSDAPDLGSWLSSAFKKVTGVKLSQALPGALQSVPGLAPFLNLVPQSGIPGTPIVIPVPAAPPAPAAGRKVDPTLLVVAGVAVLALVMTSRRR
jgi:hypothetical protein